MTRAEAPAPRRRLRTTVVAVAVVVLAAGAARVAGIDVLPRPRVPATLDIRDVSSEASAGAGGVDGAGAEGGGAEGAGRGVVGADAHAVDRDASADGALSPWPVGGWRAGAAAPVSPRVDAVGLWTGPCTPGREPPACGVAVVWGGGRRTADGVQVLTDGAAYDPRADRWWPIPAAPLRSTTPLPAVWADGRLLVWGGVDAAGLGDDPGAVRDAAGAVYDPRRGTWALLPPAPISGRSGHVLAWTGSEVVVWGGGRRGVDGDWLDLDDGAAYRLRRGTWRLLPQAPLAARSGAAAVVAGDRVVVWGGHRGGGAANVFDGAVYDPADDRWQPLPQLRAAAVRDPGAPITATLLADGDRLLLAGPFVVPWRRPVYAEHELGGRRWRLHDAPGARLWRDATVRGGPDQVVVWGGRRTRQPRPDGVIAVPGRAAWPLPDGGPPAWPGQAVVWTGHHLMVWGGHGTNDHRAALWSATVP